MKLKDMQGKTIAHWEVLRRAPNDGHKKIRWICRCDCGREKVVYGHLLRAGKSNSCGCSRPKPPNTLRPYEASYHQFCWNTKRKHLNELSYEDFLEYTSTTECVYCGAEVSWVEYGLSRKGHRYNLDRKDNSLGYSKDNCVVCCKFCNFSKGAHFSFEQFLEIGKLIRKWREKGVIMSEVMTRKSKERYAK